MAKGQGQGRELAYRIHQAVFLLDKALDKALQGRIGLGLSQFLVLKALVDLPHVPQKHVAAALDQTQAAVSRQVDILDGLGLVSRAQNPDNRREYVLALTKAGKARYAKAVLAMDAVLNETFRVLGNVEKGRILESLDRLLDRMRAKPVTKAGRRAGKTR